MFAACAPALAKATPVFTLFFVNAYKRPDRMRREAGTVVSETTTPFCRKVNVAAPPRAELLPEESMLAYPTVMAPSGFAVCLEKPIRSPSVKLAWAGSEVGVSLVTTFD